MATMAVSGRQRLMLRIVTGKGIHSAGGQSVLQPVVYACLRQMGAEFVVPASNTGEVQVTLDPVRARRPRSVACYCARVMTLGMRRAGVGAPRAAGDSTAGAGTGGQLNAKAGRQLYGDCWSERASPAKTEPGMHSRLVDLSDRR